MCLNPPNRAPRSYNRTKHTGCPPSGKHTYVLVCHGFKSSGNLNIELGSGDLITNYLKYRLWETY